LNSVIWNYYFLIIGLFAAYCISNLTTIMQAVPEYFSSILASTPIDDSTASYDWAEYRTSELNISSATAQTSDYYQITVKDIDQWVLMSKAYLRVQAQIVDRTTGAAIPDGATGLTTLAAAAAGLFQRMELLANDTPVDTVENPQFVQLINALMNYSKDMLASNASTEWLHLDFAQPGLGTVVKAAGVLYQDAKTFAGTANAILEHGAGCAQGRMGVQEAAAAVNFGGHNPYFNPGWLARWNRSRNRGGASTQFEVIIPLASVFGFCRDIQSVHRGVKWELNMQKNIRYNAILHGAAGADAQATLLKKVSLWVPQVTPSLVTEKYLEQALGRSDVVSKQYFENVTCRISEQYPSGTSDVEWLLPLEGHKPTRMVFGFQRLAQYNQQNDPALVTGANLTLSDQLHANPSCFSHMGLWDEATGLVSGGITEVELRVNSKSLPREKYRISFSDVAPEYERVYVDFLKSSGKFVDESGSAVSFKEYKDLYPLFSFDLRDYADVFSGLKSNDIRFRARLQGAQPTDFRIVMVVYSERELIVQPIAGKLSLKV